ncbi:hypothetical protein PRK78_004526 [Emydomyces testavorans]|uniref:Uncharacterized protein n=1 Tax=Emydomyces testavorans TaxID=2070801 RepID=A0AAF0DIP6_9EURO|nr:hypothetical protein PRK78_004526 [Emydomyces testavorans]
MLNLSMKRQREEELDEPPGPIVQQKKKPRPLSLRTSPAIKHITPISQRHTAPSFPISSTLTPTESSDDDPMQEGVSQSQHIESHSHAFNSMRTSCAESDSDFEMADSQPKSATMQPLLSAGSGPLRPEGNLESPIPSLLLDRSLNVSGGRTATPIFSHFTSNMNTDSMMRDTLSPTEPQCSHPSQPAATDEANWWRRRRLPSPISEDETQVNKVALDEGFKHHSKQAEQFTGTYNPPGIRISVTPAQSGMPLSGFPDAQAEHRIPSLHSRTVENQPNSGLAFGDSSVRNGSLSTLPTRPASTVSDCSTHSPRPQKLTIAMGFRADCDKCRQRVPGHYSHIIRS